MEEIREFLNAQYQGADAETKRRIEILLQNEVVTRCKCPKCGEKFEPKDGFKSGLLMYDYVKTNS